MKSRFIISLLQRMFLLCFLLLTCQLTELHSSLANTNPYPTAKEQVSLDADSTTTDNLRRQLSSKKSANQFGVRLLEVSEPSQYAKLMKKFYEASQKMTKADKTQGVSAAVYQTGREVLLNLVLGRGSDPDQNPRNGWCLACAGSSHETIKAIEETLNLGFLDKSKKEELLSELKKINWDDAGLKKKRGFPTAFNISTPEMLSQVEDLIKDAKEVKIVPIKIEEGELLTFENLVETMGANDCSTGDGNCPSCRDCTKDFLDEVQTIMYDKSVIKVTDPENAQHFYGRKKELRKIVDALSKRQKSHILLTGKAGVGKTTLVQLASDRLVAQDANILNEPAPIFIELPITDVTNQNDPQKLLKRLDLARQISEIIKRRIVLYVDEAHVATDISKNSLKAFLSANIEKIPEAGRVHLVFATTSAESRSFLDDQAFSRRWTQVHVDEFTPKQTINLIKKSLVPLWKTHYQKNENQFTEVQPEAFDTAIKLSKFEQPHAGRPGGPVELLESAISYKLNRMDKNKGEFELSSADIRSYIKSQKGISLMPGDPKFTEKFDHLWEKFESQYTGAQPLKRALKGYLFNHFQALDPKMVLAMPNMGPPGAGKSYLAEVLAKVFFNDHLYVINAADYSHGDLALNKLIGSPTGTVGSEQQRSPLTKKLRESPRLLMVIEEADYLHGDIFKFLVNLITNKEFEDGLGKIWDASQMVILLNTNAGQQHLIPLDLENNITWEQYNARRKSLVDQDEDGEYYNQEKLTAAVESFVTQTLTHSSGDGTEVTQEVPKLMRRLSRALYTMTPNRKELVASAEYHLHNFIKESKVIYGVDFDFSGVDMEKVILIEAYEFEKGHSYVEERLEEVLTILRFLWPEKGASYRIEVDSGVDKASNQPTIQVKAFDKATESLVLEDVTVHHGSYTFNPWRKDNGILGRIEKLPSLIKPPLYVGGQKLSEFAQQKLKKHIFAWGKPVIIPITGSTGNGKTKFGEALAEALFDGSKPYYTIPNLSHRWALNEYIRPPIGVEGGKEQTDFERWVLSRYESGGGVIIWDEFLSLKGLSGDALAEKIAVFNDIYELLEKGKWRVGRNVVDMRNFVMVVTGNGLQELFDDLPDDPAAIAAAEKLVARLTDSDIADYFGKYGIDRPKLARLGRILVKGPMSDEQALGVIRNEVVALETKINESRAAGHLKIDLHDEILAEITKRLKTNVQGVRKVIESGLDPVVRNPITAMIFDIEKTGTSVVNIKGQLKKDSKISWMVNGKAVDLYEHNGLKTWAFKRPKAKGSIVDRSELEGITPEPKVILEGEALNEVATHEFYGHWMTDVLLNGQNRSEGISIHAGNGHLGYVRKLDDPVLKNKSNLPVFVRSMIEFNAGSRAVVRLMNSRSAGGGSQGDKKERQDDFQRVENLIDAIFANRMLPGWNDQVHPNMKYQVKTWLWELLDEVTDDFIISGAQELSKVMTPAIEDLKQSRYFSKDQLDILADKLLPIYQKSQPDKDFDLSSKLLSALSKIIEKDDVAESVLAELNLGSSNNSSTEAQKKHVVLLQAILHMMEDLHGKLDSKSLSQNPELSKLIDNSLDPIIKRLFPNKDIARDQVLSALQHSDFLGRLNGIRGRKLQAKSCEEALNPNKK